MRCVNRVKGGELNETTRRARCETAKWKQVKLTASWAVPDASQIACVKTQQQEQQQWQAQKP